MSLVPDQIPLPPTYSREWVALFRLRALRWLRDREGRHARQDLQLALGLTADQLKIVLACPAFAVCCGCVKLTEAGEKASRAIPPTRTAVRLAGEESPC